MEKTGKSRRLTRSQSLDITSNPVQQQSPTSSKDPSAAQPSSALTTNSDNTEHPDTQEHADIAEETGDEENASDDDRGEEEDEQVRISSAVSNVSLVQAISDSEHRSFLRRVKAEMTETQEKAERRHSQFAERRVSVQERADILNYRRASRRLSQMDGHSRRESKADPSSL